MATRGIQKVRLNLKKFGTATQSTTNRAVFTILNEGAALAATYTPVDTSNLLNSQYQPQIFPQKDKIVGVVGYTAEYAFWVHEMSGKLKGQPRAHFGKTREGTEFGGGTGQGTYWSPDASPKFLERGFKETMPFIPEILKRLYGV